MKSLSACRSCRRKRFNGPCRNRHRRNVLHKARKRALVVRELALLASVVRREGPVVVRMLVGLVDLESVVPALWVRVARQVDLLLDRGGDLVRVGERRAKMLRQRARVLLINPVRLPNHRRGRPNEAGRQRC